MISPMEQKEKGFSIEAWLPHVLFHLIFIIIVAFIVYLFQPVVLPLIMSAALCTLTYPVIFEPLEKLVRKRLKKISGFALRQYIALASTLILVVLCVSPCLLLLYNATGSITNTFESIAALVLGEKEAFETLSVHVTSQIDQLSKLFPKLPIEPLKVKILDYMENVIGNLGQFAPSMIEYLFKGTGSVLIQFVLTLVGINFFYANGPKIMRAVLLKTSLNEEETQNLFDIHRRIILRLLSDSLMTSIIKGMAMALIITLITGFNFLLIALLATFISLLPMIGSAIIWLPIASLLWSQERPIAAVAVAVLCVGVIAIVDILRKKLGARLHSAPQMMNFFIFMSVIGGVLSFGLGGFIIGPIGFIFAVEIGTFWLNQYESKNDPNLHAGA